MNEQGKNCPNCQKDIGIWAITKAPLPNMITCPHCKKKIKYDRAGWGMITLCSGIYFLLLYLLISRIKFIYAMGTLTTLVTFSLLCLILWQPFEFFLATQLRKKQKLVIRGKK